MPLILVAAEPADAARIADIHMAAFSSNAMLLAQFPTPAVRNALKESIELKALADINDSKTTVLVVRDSDSTTSINTAEPGGDEQNPDRRGLGEAIAFAKWAHPISTNEDYTEPHWIWPAGTDSKLLRDWANKTEESQKHAVGDSPCYRLTFMGTDPDYERRGAATMMVQWGMNQSGKDHVPAYLESTLEAAPFYTKLGFVDVERISLQYETRDSKASKVYEEICFVYNI
ncbi:putative GNAT family acetyltransferase [Hypoxylon sp. FL1857]|nr:putative GNAT family acetyltransferase [Hypoxylon sp. FL1857]